MEKCVPVLKGLNAQKHALECNVMPGECQAIGMCQAATPYEHSYSDNTNIYSVAGNKTSTITPLTAFMPIGAVTNGSDAQEGPH